MRKLTRMFVPLIVLGVACGKNNSPAIDDALKSDLALASQAQPNGAQFVSPVEAGYAPQQSVASRSISSATRSRASTPARRKSTARRSGSGSSSASGGYYPDPTPPTTTVKHTGR